MSKEILLTKNKIAIVDDADYEWLNRWKWCAVHTHGTWYAVRRGKKNDGEQGAQYMHRIIADPGNAPIDHINGNGLDNRRENLRRCTHQENAFNRGAIKNSSSGYKGVYWDKTKRKWSAQITASGKAHRLGYFSNKIDAAIAYDAAARKLHGEFARPNFA